MEFLKVDPELTRPGPLKLIEPELIKLGPLKLIEPELIKLGPLKLIEPELTKPCPLKLEPELIKLGRLVLSSKTNYIINGKSHKLCYILLENAEPIYINTKKKFDATDTYVILVKKDTYSFETVGRIGNKHDDLNIFNLLYTINWSSNTKFTKLFNSAIDFSYDCVKDRQIYGNIVSTIDPDNSVDADDGFSINADLTHIYLDVHIVDPTSYFNLDSPSVIEVLKELISRINTCYINKTRHMFPEEFVKNVSLNNSNFPKRCITFKFKICIVTDTIEFSIINTTVMNIINYSYDEWDKTVDEKTTNIFSQLIPFLAKKIDMMIDAIDTIDSHKIIEIFMIFTNMYFGNHLKSHGIQGIIRVQEFKSALPINDTVDKYNKCPASYKFMDDTYCTHSTLKIDNYTHATSPLRRFVDCYNHMVYRDNMSEEIIKYINIENINKMLKRYKMINNNYNLVIFLSKVLHIEAFVKDINDKRITLILFNNELNFSTIIKIKYPLEYVDKIIINSIINVELFYDPYMWNSYKFPFSLKIL